MLIVPLKSCKKNDNQKPDAISSQTAVLTIDTCHTQHRCFQQQLQLHTCMYALMTKRELYVLHVPQCCSWVWMATLRHAGLLYDWPLCRYQYVAALSMQRKRVLLWILPFRRLNPYVMIQMLFDAAHVKSWTCLRSSTSIFTIQGLWVQRCLHSKLQDGANNVSLIARERFDSLAATYMCLWHHQLNIFCWVQSADLIV